MGGWIGRYVSRNNILISDHNLPILIPPYSTFSVSFIVDVNIVNYISPDLFYNNICKLLKCIRKNIMNILYDKNIYSNFCKI